MIVGLNSGASVRKLKGADRPINSQYARAEFLFNLDFVDYPIRKVYFEIYDYNTQSLSSNLQAGFTEEGCLKEYRYHNGVFHDLHILAMSRQDFYKCFEGFLCR